MTTNSPCGMANQPRPRFLVAHAAVLALMACALLTLVLVFTCRAGATDADVRAGSSFDPTRTGSIELEMLTVDADNQAVPVAGGTVALYRVADVALGDDGGLAYTACAGFEESGIAIADVSSAGLASSLASWAASDAGAACVSPQASAVPDAEGTATFSDLACGLYLVCQTQAAPGYYVMSPFLVSLPSGKAGSWAYAEHATPKVEPVPDAETFTSVTVKKVWRELASDGSAAAASSTANHGSVTVLLLVGGNEYARAELSAGNGWTYTWRDVPAAAQLAVQEADVPAGYEASYTESGNDADGHTFTVTNTAQVQKLIQTGQLMWPVPVLALAGVVLFALGWCRSRRAAASAEDGKAERDAR